MTNDVQMNTRDTIAALAMQAVPWSPGALHDAAEVYDRVASHCYKMADAMLRARGLTPAPAAFMELLQAASFARDRIAQCGPMPIAMAGVFDELDAAIRKATA